MKPTEQLKEEHEAIKIALTILEKMCEKFESGEKVDPAHLDQILEFIKRFDDKCHHTKEEELLFIAMEEVGIPKEGGPIGVMLFEHAKGWDYVKGMREAVEKYKRGDKKVSSQIVESPRNYIALLTQHIEKEDTILFHMAEMYLSRNKQEELWDKFEKVEQEEIGTGKHEEFHKLLLHLKDIYLETHEV